MDFTMCRAAPESSTWLICCSGVGFVAVRSRTTNDRSRKVDVQADPTTFSGKAVAAG
jgi:hypothetical protein